MASELDQDTILKRIPPEEYESIMLEAVPRIAALTDDSEILDILFAKDELEWLQSQYKERRI